MKMRKFLFAAMTVASVMLFNACTEEDPCKDVTCSGHGTPTNLLGICDCTCDAGYEGTACDSVSRTRFVYSNYSVTETCSRDSCGTALTIATPPYASNITAGVNIDEVKIDHFGNYGASSVVTAKVSGTDGRTLTIPTDTVLGAIFQGSGTMNAAETQITISYTVKDAANPCDVVTCVATYTK